MMIEYRRIHDKDIYLKEDRYERPKEVFKKVADLVLESGVLKEGSIVCDIGCATGEFLHYLSRLFPKAKYYGYDVAPEFLEKAKQMVPNVTFLKGSVLDRELLQPASSDVTFLLGVSAMFDDFKPCFLNVMHWTRPGGRLYILSIFNPYPIDVWVTYRRTDSSDPNLRELGWNMVSIVSVSRWLDATLGPGKYTFIPWVMPFDLPPHPDDLVRTWTFLDDQGQRLFTNGLSIIPHFYILEIRP